MTVVRLAPRRDTPAAVRPKVLHLYRRHAPQTAPCPHCGRPGRRKGFLRRTVRSLAYQAICLVHVTTAEYRARCGCCATFRTQVEGIEAKARYHNRVREAVLDRLLEDRLSALQVQRALRRDFYLDLSEGFLYDCLDWKVRQCDGAAYRQWTLAHFSGTLCVDEIHLGPHTLLLATDPLHDFAVAFALVSANDQEHMGRFLRQLQAHGLQPEVVVTDGSSLYPALLAAIWPQAAHQLCVFHVLQEINREVLAAVRRLRRAMPGRGRHRKRRRSPRGTFRPRAKLTAKDKAHFVFKQRYLIVRRRSELTAAQKRALARVLEYAPSLRVVRRFVDDVHQLLARAQTEATAWRRWQRLRGEAAYQQVPELAAVVQSVTAERFAKMIAFLRSPVGRRVRTNNHVERLNRVLRLYEKSRYKWRQGRTKVRWVCLLIARRWGVREGDRQPSPGAGAERLARPGEGASAPAGGAPPGGRRAA
jgi:Transposase